MSYFGFREVAGWMMLVARELAGWLLIVAGFGFFYWAYDLTVQGKPLNMWAAALIGIFVFRGGIHLLKVAVAARVCQQTQDQLYPAPTPGATRAPVRRL